MYDKKGEKNGFYMVLQLQSVFMSSTN